MRNLAVLLILPLFAALTSGCRSLSAQGMPWSNPESAATDEDVDHLAFLAPFLAGRFDRTIGSGEGAFEARVTTTAVMPGVLVVMQTDALRDGRWQRVVESTFGYDPYREAVVFRGWTIDGSYMDGVAFGAPDGEVVIDFALTRDHDHVKLRQRYTFDGPARCSWVTMTRENEARMFDAGEMRRAVASDTPR